MLRLTYSNHTEALLDALAARLPTSPFDEQVVIVPNRAMERVVEVGLARRRGMVANVRFERLEGWLAGRIERATGRVLLRTDELEGRLLAVVTRVDALAEGGALADVLRYVRGPELVVDASLVERRRLELATRLAQVFQEYAYSRPAWIRAWLRGERAFDEEGPRQALEAWQGALYRAARGLPSLREGARPRTTLAEELELGDAWARGPDGPAVVVFGVSYVARAFQEALARIARVEDVVVMALNPCREFWADVESTGEGRARLRRETSSGAVQAPSMDEDDPYALLDRNESALLRAWGRPGREHVAVLDELTGFDAEDRFVEADETTLLARVQRSILERRPVEGAADASICVVPCTSVRREVETVAQLVWGLIAEHERRGDPLRLPEIAVLVQAADRERYLPHLEAVFGDRRDGAGDHVALPWSAQDLALAARSRVAEAILRLFRFFRTTPTRREMLGLLAHPLVRPEGSEGLATDPEVFADLAERVGIIRGADEQDWRGTYADRAHGEGRSLHFDQGLRRLALGTVIGDETELEFAGALRPEPIAARTEETLLFVRVARSLLADHRALAEARIGLDAWGSLLDAMAVAYVRPETRGEEAELERCRQALRGLAERQVGADGEAAVFGLETALQLATRELEAISAVRGDPQTLGIVVASLLPMRAIPFRVVFVLGLGEGLFPQHRQDTGLDLRVGGRRTRDGGGRRPGDVAPDERDRYAFLETLLSTRERLVLSYVERDEETGDPHGPSSVLLELDEAVEGGLVRVRPPHRRHEALEFTWAAAALGTPVLEASTRAVMARALPGAVVEREARAHGDSERALFREYELPSEAWSQLDTSDPRRTWLELPALPAAPDDAEGNDPSRIELRVLRKFLQCPIQGRAEHWLRREDDLTTPVEEEPLDPPSRTLRRVAREAFSAALERGGDGTSLSERLTRAARAELERARGRGELPIGILGAELDDRIDAQLARWVAALRKARPGVHTARAVRLGSVSLDLARREARLEALAALVLPGEVANKPFSIEGRTSTFLRDGDGRRRELLVLAPDAVGESEKAKIERGKALLDAYVDHAVMAAMGLDDPDTRTPRRVLVVGDGDVYESVMAAVPAEAARRWLGALAKEIASTARIEPTFLPIEALFLEEEAVRRGDPRLADRVTRAIETVRTKRNGGSSRFGPIREATRYDAPEPREVLRILGRRFAPFFQHVKPAVRVAAGDDVEGLLR